MRSMWNGAISFGLVTIPVALYPATHAEELKFHQLRKSDLSPVNYKRVAEADGKEVAWEDIVKGYEYEKGKFVVLRDEDFKRVDMEVAAQTINIMDFVDVSEINPMYFQKPYYLEPQKGGDKAYALLRDALKDSGKIGIAKVIIRTREHLAGVKAQDQSIVLEIMHFSDELVNAEVLRLPKSDLSTRELNMATKLIEGMTTSWDPGKYSDSYKTQMMSMIEEKIKHPDAPTKGAVKKQKPGSNIVDLMNVLQQSLSQTKEKLADRKSKSKTPQKAVEKKYGRARKVA